MEPFALVSRYFWLIAIMVTGINGLIFRIKTRKYIEEDPRLEEGYAALFRGYIVWMNIPWVVMGVGCTVGGVPSFWHYFRPRDANPYVLAWFGSVLLLWVLGTFWLFVNNGAETLASHPGAMVFRCASKSKDITNPMLIKAVWLLTLACGIVAAAIMWFVDIPIPAFR